MGDSVRSLVNAEVCYIHCYISFCLPQPKSLSLFIEENHTDQGGLVLDHLVTLWMLRNRLLYDLSIVRVK